MTTKTNQPQTEGTSALALTPEQQVAMFVAHEAEISREGFGFIPGRVKAEKSCLFVDDLGEPSKELRGVAVFKQRTRGYWPKGVGKKDKVPSCTSEGMLNEGIDREGSKHDCASCPLNAWGSGTNEAGEPTRGKACKEMRRMFLVRTDEALPIMISFAPSSIKNYDTYWSGRCRKKINDVDREVVVTLSSQAGSEFDYAVAEFKLGDEVPVEQRISFARMREMIRAAAEKIGITADDYESTPDAETESVY